MEKKIVLPGDFLATEEEFAPGKNTFDSEGNVHSGSVGSITTDNKSKLISVEPAVPLHAVEKDSIVFGVVALVKENSVLISLGQNPEREQKQIIMQSNAMLPIRNVSREYVQSLKECFKIGDIVKAVVSKILPAGIDLATNRPELGVIKAFCSRCRHPLHVFGGSLRCLNCGSEEKRKTATGYLVK